MKIFESVAPLKGELSFLAGKKVGFVPTMGALHAGHISLVEMARRECDVVVVSIFVNPTQFNDPNDLQNYPRTVTADAALLKSAGVDIIFLPNKDEIYPINMPLRQFNFGCIEQVMEGASRPGHFNGVGQVVSRLFEIVEPDKAFFGEKDFQQIAVIKDMCKQLKLKVQIVECPIIRDADGLALSSRNTLLTPEHRKAAPIIYEALCDGKATEMHNGTPECVRSYIEVMINSNPLLKVIYVKVVDSLTLQDVAWWDRAEHIQCCVAVQAGAIRLIDNIKLK